MLVPYHTDVPMLVDLSREEYVSTLWRMKAAAEWSASLAVPFYKIFTTSQRLLWGSSLASEKKAKEIYGVSTDGAEFDLSLPGSAS